MTRAAPPLGWIRRHGPQKVRTRLTLLYAVLFFAAGSALLGLTYGLVASSLPATPAANPNASLEQAKLLQQCNQERARAPAVPKPQLPACQQLKAFSAGASSGSQTQRQRALNELLVFSLVGLGVMTVISGGLGWVVSGRVLRPVRVITETARLGLRVDTELDPAETTGDQLLLEQMIGNLVDNAVRHNEPGGWVRLRTGACHAGVYFQVANSGPVIPDDAVPTLFEPFRRLEGRTGLSDGVGLGLSIARSVADVHGATVSARGQPGGGLDISVVIPRS